MVYRQNEGNIYCLTFAPEKRSPMKRVAINTFEDIHHVCLMYGLKKAFLRFPFLTADIMATPPPVRRNPERPSLFLGFRRHPVNVQYYNKDIHIIYNEDKIVLQEAVTFAKAVIVEYLAYRHPYMKTVWTDGSLSEAASGHVVAQITPESPMTVGKP